MGRAIGVGHPRRVKAAVLVLCFTLPLLASPAVHGGQLNLPPVPVVDGRIAEGEYGATGCQPIALAPVPGPGRSDGYAGRLCAAHDGRTLYLAVEVSNDPTVSIMEPFDHLLFFFTAPDLWSRVGDDVIQTPFGGTAVADEVVFGVQENHPLYYDWDTNRSGSVNVEFAVDYERHVFELSHPLCSGEPTDFCLQPGDTIGFCLLYWDLGPGPVGATYPAGCGKTAEGDSAKNALLRLDPDSVASQQPHKVRPPATGDAGLLRSIP